MSNYSELGDTETLKPTYNEGDYYRHPGGALYQRRNGSWVYIPPEEEPKS